MIYETTKEAPIGLWALWKCSKTRYLRQSV